MKRLNALVHSAEYMSYLSVIEEYERNREFCGHNTAHFLDVSRILYILCIENGLNIDKELVYATGFLHDIGRAKQYSVGMEHHKASALIAAEMLPRYGFDGEETELIIKGVIAHRKSQNNDIFCRLVYTADKKSRPCLFCKALDKCNWHSEKLNTEIDI